MTRPFVEDYAVERYRKGSSTYYFTQGLGATARSTLALTANRLYGCPFFVPATQKYDYAAIIVTTKSNNGNARMGIYGDLGTVAPGPLILDFGAVAITAAQVYAIDLTATPITLTPGLYWLALVTDVVNTIGATAVGTNLTCFMGLDSTLGTAWQTFVYVAFNYAALPNPFTTPVTIATGANPAVFMRKV